MMSVPFPRVSPFLGSGCWPSLPSASSPADGGAWHEGCEDEGGLGGGRTEGIRRAAKPTRRMRGYDTGVSSPSGRSS
jgi:hypothetical protein